MHLTALLTTGVEMKCPSYLSEAQKQTKTLCFLLQEQSSVCHTCLVGQFNLLCVFAATLVELWFIYFLSVLLNMNYVFSPLNPPPQHTHTTETHQAYMPCYFEYLMLGKAAL